MVIADATTVGYAIQQRLAGIIWVGVVFPITIIMVVRVAFLLSVPVLATAVAIETKYSDPRVGGLTCNFVATSFSFGFFTALRAAAMTGDEDLRISAMAGLK